MKRKIKKGSTIYSFLDKQGVLENGNDELIEIAKKRYWSDFRKEYKKIKRKESKSFEIFFNFKEAKIINSEASKYHTTPPNYIKQSALLNKKSIVDHVAIGEIRELVIMHHNTLLAISEENGLAEPIGGQLLNQASLIEKRVLEFFSLLK